MTFLLSGAANGLDWQIIQEQLGAHASPSVYWPSSNAPPHRPVLIDISAGEVLERGETLFAEDFESDEYAGLTADRNGKGKCTQIPTSGYAFKDRVPFRPGHWIMIAWQARTVSGEQGTRIEVEFQDAEGKTLGKHFRHTRSRLARQGHVAGPGLAGSILGLLL